jgi:chemotaxis protein methyltransferase CheR
MANSTEYNLSYINFEGKTPTRPKHYCAHGVGSLALADGYRTREQHLDDFISWVMDRAGLDSAAYRIESLYRRLPTCLRILKAHSTRAARELLERQPDLLTKVISSMLIGVTEFFREPGVFDFLRTQILPSFIGHGKPLRIWVAACSSGAEIYSMAILLAELGLLERSFLLGTDCRVDAIMHATMGLYDEKAMRLVPSATRHEYFEPAGRQWRPVERVRKQVHWKVANLLADVEPGPWDMIFWRNSAIYLNSYSAENVWHRLISVLAPDGVLIPGKAEQPPNDASLKHAGRCVYRKAMSPVSGTIQPIVKRFIDKEAILEIFG